MTRDLLGSLHNGDLGLAAGKVQVSGVIEEVGVLGLSDCNHTQVEWAHTLSKRVGSQVWGWALPLLRTSMT